MHKKPSAPPPLDIDKILPELGPFGRYQRFVFCYLSVAVIFTSIYNIQYIFAAGAVEYRCRVPACESSPEQFKPNGWAKFALPSEGFNCMQKVPIGNKCEPASFSNETRRCHSWVYENQLTIVPESKIVLYASSIKELRFKNIRIVVGLPRFCSASGMFAQQRTAWFHATMHRRSISLVGRVRGSSNTVLAMIADRLDCAYMLHCCSRHVQFDLACQDWKRTLVGTIHNVGVFMAIPSTATISDAFGRRVALIGTAVLPAIFGMARAFCNNYVLYLFLEFVEALVGNGTYSTAFIIGLEIVGLKKRVIGGNILQCTFAIGQVMAAVCAWAMPYWRTYLLVIFTPSLLFITYIFFVEESVRWLIAKGKRDEAVRIILKMARFNRVTLLPKTMNTLRYGPRKQSAFLKRVSQRAVVKPVVKEKSLFKQVIRSKTIRFRMVVVSFWWITTTMIYYGLSINSVGLVGNKYLNFIMTALIEIPGSLLCYCTLDRFGRKSTLMTSFFMCAIALLSLPAVNNTTLMITLTLLGKMMISLIFCGIYIYTIELFPTQARHSLMGFCSMTGRIGSMCAPQTPLLMAYMKSLPYLLFGAMAGCAGMLMLLTPETLHIKLPDTISQAEQMDMATRTRKTTNIIVDNLKVHG